MKHLILILASILVLAPTQAQDSIYRFATWNIEKLDANDNPIRLEAVRNVLSTMDADVIALQEIDDRSALEAVFKPAEWHLVIDDNSGEIIDLALAIRKNIALLTDSNANDDDFLFPGAENDDFFPDRRDVLHVRLGFPGLSQPFHVLVVHAKSRSGGTLATEPRRIGAARALLQKLDEDFDDQPYILLGDFNDNPDDQSLNILETGNIDAQREIENKLGDFLVNLSEPLLNRGLVSWSLDRMDIINNDQQFDNQDFNSRQRNFSRLFSQNLLDQILIPRWFYNCYIPGSIHIFNGIENQGASDHLPVYCDLIIADPLLHDSVVYSGLLMTAILPNPDGKDAGNEEIHIRNFSDSTLQLSGWQFRDKSGHSLLMDSIAASPKQLNSQESYIVHIPTTASGKSSLLPLTNSGDEIHWISPDANIQQSFSYTSVEASSGNLIIIIEDSISQSPNPRIISLLPNPNGKDAGNEQVTIQNFGTGTLTLTDWSLRNKNNQTITLGTIPGLPSSLGVQQSLVLTIPANANGTQSILSLSNNGDNISLIKPDSQIHQTVNYTKSQVQTGIPIQIDPL